MLSKKKIIILLTILVVIISMIYFFHTTLLIKDFSTKESINSGWITTINLHLFKIPSLSPQGGTSKPIFSQSKISEFKNGKHSFTSYSLNIPFNIVKTKIVCVLVPGYKISDKSNLKSYKYEMRHGCFKLSPFTIRKTIYLEKEEVVESYYFLNHIWGVPPGGQIMSYLLFDYTNIEYDRLQNLDTTFLEKEENYDYLHNKAYFYFETAVYFDNLSLCEKSDFMKNRCYQELAEKRKDAELCDKVVNVYVQGTLIQPSKDYCLERVSIVSLGKDDNF